MADKKKKNIFTAAAVAVLLIMSLVFFLIAAQWGGSCGSRHVGTCKNGSCAMKWYHDHVEDY